MYLGKFWWGKPCIEWDRAWSGRTSIPPKPTYELQGQCSPVWNKLKQVAGARAHSLELDIALKATAITHALNSNSTPIGLLEHCFSIQFSPLHVTSAQCRSPILRRPATAVEIATSPAAAGVNSRRLGNTDSSTPTDNGLATGSATVQPWRLSWQNFLTLYVFL